MLDYSLEIKETSTANHSHCQIQFNAMASPCEILIRCKDLSFCHQLAILCTNEVQRIESKYSRYQTASLLSKVNSLHEQAIEIDKETFQLLNYARELFELSDGLFDITSGALHRLWHFKNQSSVPNAAKVQMILPSIGFDKIQYSKKSITLPKNVEIDFGGIGKEYAVDRLAEILHQHCKNHGFNFLVNLGGDLFAKDYRLENSGNKKTKDNKANIAEKKMPWIIGLETSSSGFIELLNGAVATSGTSQRSFNQNGKTYSHLLNPKTGWPIKGPPKSVTCFADRCVLAGTYSSLAMLQGKNAEIFLEKEKIEHIIVR